MEDGSDLLLDLIYLRSPGRRGQFSGEFTALRNSVAHGREKPTVLVKELLNERLPSWNLPEKQLPPNASGLISSVVLELEAWPWGQLTDGQSQAVAGRLFEAVLDIRSARLGRRAAQSTSPQLAGLMARLCVHKNSTVLDPACGDGALLIAASECGATQLAGADTSHAALARTSMRLEFSETAADLALVDSLGRFLTTSAADAVLTSPPFGLRVPADRISEENLKYGVPPQSRSDLAWLQVALANLKPRGRAAVLLPVGSLFRGGSEARIRSNLLDAGVIEAIISLPSGLLPGTAIKTAIWVLRSPAELDGPQPVLMMSAADFASRTRRARTLSDAGIDTVVNTVRRWRSDQDLYNVPASVASVVTHTSVDADVNLVPERFLDVSTETNIERPTPPRRLISQLRIANVKAFDGIHSIDLAPITLLYGPNSSGKSSIVQALTLLKQSLHESRFTTQGDLADAGSYEGLVHKHQADRSIGLGITFGALEEWNLEGATPDPSLMRSIDFEFSSHSSENIQQKVSFSIGPVKCEFTGPNVEDSFSISPLYRVLTTELESLFGAVADPNFTFPPPELLPPGESPDANRRLEMKRRIAMRALRNLEQASGGQVSVESDGLLPTTRFDSTDLDRFFAGREDQDSKITGFYMNRALELLEAVGAEVRTLFSQTSYLGPLRSAPQRFHSRAGVTARETAGENVALHLFDHSSEAEEVNEWLDRLEIPYTVQVRPVQVLGGGAIIGDTVAMTLTDTRSAVEVSPTDVGFGVSQVLPIVVQLLARESSVICVEQPEIHLHPRIQTYLADLLIQSASPTGGHNQIIAETHSEHLLLRLQRRIREGELDPSDVAVIYVDQDENGAAGAQRLRMDKDGFFIDPWPAGFFDESLDEIFGG